jgi:hypothetical protein
MSLTFDDAERVKRIMKEADFEDLLSFYDYVEIQIKNWRQ